MHSIFNKIYILNFDTSPEKWIQCKHRLRRFGIFGERIEITSQLEHSSYTKWRENVPISIALTFEDWCITRAMINAIQE